MWAVHFAAFAQFDVAAQKLASSAATASGHIGISLYDVAAQKKVYGYNDSKYFIPASTTKLFTLYAGMKYLGDSIPAMGIAEDSFNIYLRPAGDPTFLHPGFPNQPLMAKLASSRKNLIGLNDGFTSQTYGLGWSWDDYMESFMNERNGFPVYGNNIVFSGKGNSLQYFPKRPVDFADSVLIKLAVNNENIVSVKREFHTNIFTPVTGNRNIKNVVVPFITSLPLAYEILGDTLGREVLYMPELKSPSMQTFYSRPLDSLLIPMMYESDNFFAEQTLLMVSDKKLGYKNTEEIIENLLATDLANLPDKPKWVDGSGLSRYNLLTPADFTWLLAKMQAEQSWSRLTAILPTGGKGTLKNYYQSLSGKIYAKTGTISNNFCLSGYLITKANKKLAFSIMANNYIGGATAVRRAIETFLQTVYDSY